MVPAKAQARIMPFPTITPPPDPDLPLIQAIARGDGRALHELYTRHGANVLNYLRSYLDDRQLAEEVLQDVMMAV